MKVVQKGREDSTERTLKEIPIGTVFMGVVSTYPMSTFLKAFEMIVDLESPNKTWAAPDTAIHDYKEVNAVLYVGGEEEKD